MMDLQHIGRLKEEQWRALAETEEKLTQWEKFKSDYTALKERLETLPDKVTHDVMVPFGSMAFMPGQLIHTNEIMVLLGDNWFVERSAKQAAEIVDRRIAGVDLQIKDLQRQKKLLEPRLQFASELMNPSQEEQYFEITEEYNPEKEKAWKEQHKNNVQKYKKRLKEEERKKEEGGKDVTDEDLWARLDQLEMIEAEKKEMENLSDEETEVTSGDRKEQQKSFSTSHDRRVHWKDLQTGDTDSGEESDIEDSDDYDDEEEQEAELLQPTRRINFTHTNVLSQQVTEINTDSSADKTEEPVVQNPGDIFRIYGRKNDNKCILKQSATSKDGTKQKVETGSMSKGATSAVAFSGKVIEKQSSAGLGPTSLTDSGNIAEKPKPVEQPKRVSKFRAQRQKIHEPS